MQLAELRIFDKYQATIFTWSGGEVLNNSFWCCCSIQACKVHVVGRSGGNFGILHLSRSFLVQSQASIFFIETAQESVTQS